MLRRAVGNDLFLLCRSDLHVVNVLRGEQSPVISANEMQWQSVYIIGGGNKIIINCFVWWYGKEPEWILMLFLYGYTYRGN